MEASGTMAVRWAECGHAEVTEFAEWIHALAARRLGACDSDDAAQGVLLALWQRHRHENPRTLRGLAVKVLDDEARRVRQARTKSLNGVDMDRLAVEPRNATALPASRVLARLRASLYHAGLCLTRWESQLFDDLLAGGTTLRGLSRGHRKPPRDVKRGINSVARKLRIVSEKCPESRPRPDG